MLGKIITSTLILLALQVVAISATIHVPGDKPTIQEGIDAASNGDTVLVAEGVYMENIDFKGKAITVKSSGAIENTIIDGGNPAVPGFGSVVTFKSGENTNSELNGFTIRNGSGTIDYFKDALGGGIYCNNSSPTIINNKITNNTAYGESGYGGGIYCYSSSPVIMLNIISENHALSDNSYWAYGGGIYCYDSNPIIINNMISKNDAKSEYGGEGGGILCDKSSPNIDNNIIVNNFAGCGCGVYCYDYSSPTINNNEIYNNKGEVGGGIYCYGYSSPIIDGNKIYDNITEYCGGILCEGYSMSNIVNNMVYGNKSEAYGGGIGVATYSTVTVTNNTVFDNHTDYEGGGIYVTGSTVTIANTIFWNNSAPEGPEIWIGEDWIPSTVTIDYSDIDGGLSSVHVEPNCTLLGKNALIDDDPLFDDSAAGNLHLTWLSPCVKRGTNNGAPSNDIDGDNRPFMGTVDMGADEYVGTHAMEADSFSISQSMGGTVNFYLHGSANNAFRNYIIFGSLTGTAPGTPLQGGYVTLPITWDNFTNIVLAYANTHPFTNFQSSLDANGEGTAALNLAPVSGAAGPTMYFAYALNSSWDFVSNPVAILITP